LAPSAGPPAPSPLASRSASLSAPPTAGHSSQAAVAPLAPLAQGAQNHSPLGSSTTP
jgi:hypothetical protein